MIKKYISKFTIDILPSIIATIIGAYIVTHYINPKNDTGKPAASVTSTPDAAIDSKAAVASPAEKSADIVSAPVVPAGKPRVEKASIDKSEKDNVSPPANGRHQPVIREKPVAKAPVAAPAAVAPPPSASVSTAPAVSPTPEERRDANELARAAIERLRATREPQDAAKPVEPPHVQEATRAVAPAAQPLQQLPAPIIVATPSTEAYGPASRPPYAADRAGSRAPVPPGDIPSPPPLDLQADIGRASRPERTNVAEDVLSAAKSVFHSVIPRSFER